MASTSPPPDPPPVPPAVVKRVQATRKLKLNVSDTTVLIQRLNSEWTEHLQSLPIREDAIFSNIQRVATCLANAQLKVLVETVRPGNADRIIDSLLSTPTVPGRNVVAMTQSPVQHADSWQIRWKLNDTGPYALSTRQATISDTVPYFQVQKGDDVTIRKVADVLGELHNIWPYPDTDPGTRSMFVQIAVRRATNTNNKIVLQPHYEPEFGFVLRLWHIDPDTGLAKIEYLCGRPCPDGNDFWKTHSERFTSHKIPPCVDPVTGFTHFIWKAEQIKNFRKLAREYQQEFNVELQYSTDGCPYIGLYGAMEPLYGWNGAAVLCQERLHRMTLYCNRRHETIDTEFTLFAEMIRSACVMMACLDGRCLEEDGHGPSHLPFCLRIRNGLRLAVAHRHHGHQMTTGWRVDEPSSKHERDAANSNILIEACSTNWLKWDYEEKFYQQMHDNVASARVPSMWYDPMASPPRGRDAVVADETSALSREPEELYPPVDESSHGDPASLVQGETVAESEQESGEKASVAPLQSMGQRDQGVEGFEPLVTSNTTDEPVQHFEESTSNPVDETNQQAGEQIPSGFSLGLGQQSESQHRQDGNNAVVWRLERHDYTELAATDLVQPGHDAHNIALVVELHGYARTDNSFRTLHDSRMIGTIIDGELLVNVGRLAEQVSSLPEPASAASNNAYTVITRDYEGDEVPGRLPGTHPLASFVVRGPNADPALHGYGDTSQRFRNGAAEVIAQWKEVVPGVLYEIYRGDSTLAFVQHDGSRWALFPRN